MKHSDIMEAVADRASKHRYNTDLPVGRKVIAQVIEDWATGDGNISDLSRKHNVTHTSISRWITKYYLPVRGGLGTKTIVIKSKV